MPARPIELPLTPAQAFDAWPGDWPLAALWSGDPSASRSRWTVLARPSRTIAINPQTAADSFLPPGAGQPGAEPSGDQDRAGEHAGRPDTPTQPNAPAQADTSAQPDTPPFQSGWIGFLSYDLGRVLEPRARFSVRPRCETSEQVGALAPSPDRACSRSALSPAAVWPLSVWARCDDALIYDHTLARWWLAGSPSLPEALLKNTREIAEREPISGSFTVSRSDPVPVSPRRLTLSALTPVTPRATYIRDTARVLDYIRAGDIYQANLAHTLTASFSGSARSLFSALAARARPWYGAYLELNDVAPAPDSSGSLGPASPDSSVPAHRRAILSLSPELFLSFDPSTRRVETRPMKGTRPASPPLPVSSGTGRGAAKVPRYAGGGEGLPALRTSTTPTHSSDHSLSAFSDSAASASYSDLYSSEKDRAELNMIIDLLRNDLGRVCDFGSVRVEQPRAIEQHGASSQSSSLSSQPSLLQATATISARLRGHLSLADLLRATFPGGSITGAPKIRAMQIIDELEPAPRGPYCGSIGFIADTGHAAFNIAIRTALITANNPTIAGWAGSEAVPLPPASSTPAMTTISLASSLDYFSSATLSYSVGAGIVADSSPDSEWQETIDKASIWSGLTGIAESPSPARG